MLFHSSIRKELARAFGATLVVLATIVMTMMLIRTLGQASQGIVNPSEVGLLMGYIMLVNLPSILTMTLFIATVGTLSRMYLESEMIIWRVSGQGLFSLIAPVLRFAWPILLMVGALVLLAGPWSNQQISELRTRFEQRGDLERVEPGQFQESANGTRVFFIDKDSAENKEGKNVFISSTDHGKQAMTSAQRGRLETIDGDRFLMLESGQRIEQTKDSPDLKVSEFKTYGTRIGHDVKEAATVPPKSMHTWQLAQQPTLPNLGELSWRIGIALASPILLIIALAITSANPRVGRSGNLALALFVFIVYFNFINLGQSWVSNGQIHFLPFLLLLHGSALALALTWLTVRHKQWNWRQLLGIRPENKEAA